MRMAWATEIFCDSCAARAQVRLAGPGISTQIPAGWLGSDQPPGMNWELRDPFASSFRDICPACSALPVTELITRIIELSKDLASGNRS